MIEVQASAGGCSFRVKVHPGARRNAAAGEHDGALKISLTAPPVDGKANEALVGFLQEWLGGRVSIVKGATSRLKTVRVEGVSAAAVMERMKV